MNLDRCTGDFIIHARAAGITMEKSYSRVQIYQRAARKACATAVACPEAQALLVTLMTGEAVIERGVQAYWTEQKTIWESEVSLRCTLPWGVQHSEYPSFPFDIVRPELGIAEFHVDEFFLRGMDSIQLHLRSGKQTSMAQVERRSKNDWKIRWTE